MVKALLNNQESCIINGGFSHQSDPISAYLFILVCEIVFNLIKQNKDIHGLTFFDHTSLYTAYADDITFSLRRLRICKKGN